MNEPDHIGEDHNSCPFGGRTLDDMANAYSRRAREARAKQGKRPVIAAPAVLSRLAEIMATEGRKPQRPTMPAA